MDLSRDKSERNKYFAELFREVRLVYVSRDYLYSDIVPNDLVNHNEGCMDLVRDAMKIIDSENCHHFTVKPRTSLETTVLMVYVQDRSAFHDDDDDRKDHILCYHPRLDNWSRIHVKLPLLRGVEMASCRSKLYVISQFRNKLLRYDSFSNSLESLPYEEQRSLLNVFVRNNDEMYALLSEKVFFEFGSSPEKGRLSFLSKYKPESNSWKI